MSSSFDKVHRGAAVDQADVSYMSKACCHARAPLLDVHQSHSALNSSNIYSNYYGHQLFHRMNNRRVLLNTNHESNNNMDMKGKAFYLTAV